MDITESTKQLNSKVEQLKSKFTDPVSQVFIDFYCQCKQGIDYLFPADVKESIRLWDIVEWFFECVGNKSPSTLVELMWKDVVGPSLREYKEDEATEERLYKAFQNDRLRTLIKEWDRVTTSSGNVRLILRELLGEISQIEREHKKLTA
ncbi:hypothetical protein NUACC21_43510 [Scytonema sp. NUACC21]